MKVQANVSFVGSVDGTKFRANEGDIFELPNGVDWLNAGLVSPFKGEVEKAVVIPPEKAVAPPQQEESEPVQPPSDPTDELAELVGEGPAAALAKSGFGTPEAAKDAIAIGLDLEEIDGVGPATVRKLEAFEPEPEEESEDDTDEEGDPIESEEESEE